MHRRRVSRNKGMQDDPDAIQSNAVSLSLGVDRDLENKMYMSRLKFCSRVKRLFVVGR